MSNPLVCPMYGKQPISVQVRFEGDSGRFSDPWDQGLTGVYGKEVIAVHRIYMRWIARSHDRHTEIFARAIKKSCNSRGR